MSALRCASISQGGEGGDFAVCAGFGRLLVGVVPSELALREHPIVDVVAISATTSLVEVVGEPGHLTLRRARLPPGELFPSLLTDEDRRDEVRQATGHDLLPPVNG